MKAAILTIFLHSKGVLHLVPRALLHHHFVGPLDGLGSEGEGELGEAPF